MDRRVEAIIVRFELVEVGLDVRMEVFFRVVTINDTECWVIGRNIARWKTTLNTVSEGRRKEVSYARS